MDAVEQYYDDLIELQRTVDEENQLIKESGGNLDDPPKYFSERDY